MTICPDCRLKQPDSNRHQTKGKYGWCQCSFNPPSLRAIGTMLAKIESLKINNKKRIK